MGPESHLAYGNIVEIIDAGANPVLCKYAIKPIISGIATGRSGTMSIDCINRTNFDHALSYCVRVDGDSDACISLSIKNCIHTSNK